METLTLANANVIIAKALEKKAELGFAQLTVAVLDAGGHLISLQREDRSSILRPQIAIGKAYGVLAMGFGGRELARRAPKNPHFFGALSDMSGGRLVPVPGGVLVRSQSGEIIGSVGISGDISENDEICAVAGITAAELVPDTGDAL